MNSLATEHPALAALLEVLHGRLAATLGTTYRSLIIHGSLALGDFDPQTSDIDLLVVTSRRLVAAEVARLAAMHAALAAEHPRWATELEVSYLPLAALPRHEPDHPAYPRLARGEALVVEPHHSDWVIQRHIIREHGLLLAGEDIRPLIAPVSAAALRSAVLDIRWWWAEQCADPRLLAQDAYQAYAVLSMCRMLYTLHLGKIASKPAAARWARAGTARPWVGLIDAALAWRPGQALDRLAETIAFVRWTLAESARIAA